MLSMLKVLFAWRTLSQSGDCVCSDYTVMFPVGSWAFGKGFEAVFHKAFRSLLTVMEATSFLPRASWFLVAMKRFWPSKGVSLYFPCSLCLFFCQWHPGLMNYHFVLHFDVGTHDGSVFACSSGMLWVTQVSVVLWCHTHNVNSHFTHFLVSEPCPTMLQSHPTPGSVLWIHPSQCFWVPVAWPGVILGCLNTRPEPSRCTEVAPAFKVWSIYTQKCA